jgi:hypothetical protein
VDSSGTVGSCCSTSNPCAMGAFCNFDPGEWGAKCEACDDCGSGCNACGLPNAGANDCISACPGLSVHLSFPYVRPSGPCLRSSVPPFLRSSLPHSLPPSLPPCLSASHSLPPSHAVSLSNQCAHTCVHPRAARS